ncbi:MAG: EAL domain-containing protein [Pseudomonadota bacterium]
MANIQQSYGAPLAAARSEVAKKQASTQRLRRAYILALAVIACLSCATYIMLDRLISNQSVAATTINMAGRQSMLSQRVAGLAQAIAASRALQNRSGDLIHLQRQQNAFFSAVRLMKESHVNLVEGNKVRGTPGIQDEKEREFYFDEPHQIDAKVRAFLALAEKVKTAADPDQARSIANELSDMARVDLLTSLNAVADYDEARAHAHSTHVQTVHLAILIATLLLLMGEGIFIFRPLERSLQRNEKEVAEAREQLLHESLHDALTGLGNRQALRREIELRQKCGSIHAMSVIALDLDRFKTFNDVVGHPQGDRLLVDFANILRNSLRDGDVAIRMGGDEFVILAHTEDYAREIELLCKRIAERFAQRPTSSDAEPCVTASFGIAAWPVGGDFSQAYAEADCALYEAKRLGRANAVVFEASMRAALQRENEREQEIAAALNENRFAPHFQPQLDMRTGRVIGVEALARMTGADGTVQAPSYFLATAERTGQIVALGKSIISQAIAQAGEWHGNAIEFGRLSVNVSVSQMLDDGFVTFLENKLQGADLPAEKLCIEVLESVLLDDDHNDIVDVATRIHALGIAIDLDDFGTGHTSIANVTRLHIDRIKIDRSFVANALEDERNRHVLTAVLSMGKAMGIDVLAEGIETDLQRRLLVELGCRQGQGYHFAKPMSGCDLSDWLSRNSPAIGSIQETFGSVALRRSA